MASFGNLVPQTVHEEISPTLGIAEFSRLYTIGELTLCQAVHAARNYAITIARRESPSTMPRAPSTRELLLFLGHRLHPQDEIAVEVGFDGDMQEWLDKGNLPRGWHCLFKDNYKWYGGTCIPQDIQQEMKTETTVVQPSDLSVQPVANENGK